MGPGGYVTELAYDATDLQPDDLSMILWIRTGLNSVPTVRGVDTVVPHREGQIERSRVADKLSLELIGWVLGRGDTVDEVITNFRETVETLKSLFDATAGAKTLSCVLENGSFATISCRAVPPILIEEVVASHVARVSIALESLDPYWVITPAGS